MHISKRSFYKNGTCKIVNVIYMTTFVLNSCSYRFFLFVPLLLQDEFASPMETRHRDGFPS